LMKIKAIMLSILFLFGITPVIHASELEMLDSMSFKVTVIQDGVETEWEFINPDDYEIETGETVIKDVKAESEVKELYTSLGISESSKIEDMVDVIRNKKQYRDIEKVDVRWINRDGKLYTWMWEKDGGK
jgi:hypothetical protein